ncbi:hypothetical protein EC396_05585 [Lutibacter sp. HS1-25]|uniref:hypothetical protein n=1 Tax=Lutibacter sp. HS1-25 TaxID=2485000 RepID=UPI00101284F8|nr:hypothetical protein [Lutibacter sp. HS1-25]RXP59372.1 hypothetical protein EC396_05585 [Lutibacter sp. HS1-25]
MERRSFMHFSVVDGVGLMLPTYACMAINHKKGESESATKFEIASLSLLTNWCDAMIRDQINNSSDPVSNGALYCHACGDIHGRCQESVFPFLYMADKTVGPLFTASMAEYLLVEPYNQQPQPGEDFCLTPRVVRFVDDVCTIEIV